MSSYEVCQHCSSSVRASRAVFRDGYSYHRRCRKCYVCSETDLQGAEVFRGVIFCASCAKRIFRGCATARVGKQPARRGRRRGHARASERSRRQSRACDRSVLERARAGSSASSMSSPPHSKTESAVPSMRRDHVSQDCYCVSDVVTQARRLINFIYFQTQNLVKNDKDLAQCTEVCQRMLADVCPLPGTARAQPTPELSQPELYSSSELRLDMADCCTSHSHSRCRPRSRSKGKDKKSKKMEKEAEPCSDLRIAELGASVEIATMALRKASTKRVKSESKVTQKVKYPETISMFSNRDSGAITSQTSNEEYLDSVCKEYRGSKEADEQKFDNTFANIVRIPCRFFKKNILERSSLVSVIATAESQKNFRAAYNRLKTYLRDDILTHQLNGYKKLYSTINKKKIPYKLGWLESDVLGDRKNCPCRHYAECHSYRCMRKQVMRLAGPTESKMFQYRRRAKKLVSPPFFRNISLQYRSPTAKPAVCNMQGSQAFTIRSSQDQSRTRA